MKVTDTYSFYQKLNSDCPDAEKVGSGRGSCSGGSSSKIDPPPNAGNLNNDEKYSKLRDTLKNTAKVFENNDDLKSSIKQYTEYSYSDVNKNLRSMSEEETQNYIKSNPTSIISRIDAAFKDPSAKLNDDVTLFTGINIKNAYGNISKDMRSFIDSAQTKGAVIDFKGYKSTSAAESPAYKFGSVILELDAPKGTKAIYIGKVNEHLGYTGQEESEVLLDRNSKVMITDPIKPVDGFSGKFKGKGMIIS